MSLNQKSIRQRGKISLSKYFQKFQPGDRVAVVRDLSVLPFGYSHRIQGRTGVVLSKRGEAYYIEVKELGKAKRYSLKPAHLKKIEDVKK